MVNTHLSAVETVALIRLADKAERNSQKSPENNALIAYVEELLHGRVEAAIKQGYRAGSNDAARLAKFGIDVTING